MGSRVTGAVKIVKYMQILNEHKQITVATDTILCIDRTLLRRVDRVYEEN